MSQEKAAVPSELRSALRREQQVDVIVNLREPRAAHVNRVKRADRANQALDRPGRAQQIAALLDAVTGYLGADFQRSRAYRHVPAVAGTITQAGLERLVRHPAFAGVALDHRGRGQLLEAVPAVQAGRVHSLLGLTGKAVRVAVLDTGVEADHPDLRDAIVAQHCYLRNGCAPLQRNEGDSAADDNGHGTSIAGVIASRGRLAGPGFAPGAEIIAVKVLGADGTGQESDWIGGLDWLYDNLETLKPAIVNLSFITTRLFADGTCDSAAPALAAAIENLVRAGVAVFGASGNLGSSTRLSIPACTTGVISVGASYDSDVGPMPSGHSTFQQVLSGNFADCRDDVTGLDRIACFTNTSPRLDLIAPGLPITSAWIGGATAKRAGTSNAAAAAAGVAALIRECNGDIGPAALKRVLISTGMPLRDPRNELTFPMVQALAAVREACPDVQPVEPQRVDAGTARAPDAGATGLARDAGTPKREDAADAGAPPDAIPSGMPRVAQALDAGLGSMRSGLTGETDVGIMRDEIELPEFEPKHGSLNQSSGERGGSCSASEGARGPVGLTLGLMCAALGLWCVRRRP